MIEGWKSERLGHCLLGHGMPFSYDINDAMDMVRDEDEIVYGYIWKMQWK